MIGIDVQSAPSELTLFLRAAAGDVAILGPLARDILGELHAEGGRSFDRAQQIPLAPSTLRRKKYPRRSARGAAVHETRKATSPKGLALAAKGKALRPLGPNATKRPKPNARVLERVGGFIESLTAASSPFDIEQVDEAAGRVTFGTKLGGLWAIFGARGRLDFLMTTESRDALGKGILEAQERHVAAALERAGAPREWVSEIEAG